MYSNIAELSTSEQRSIELSKKASLLINNLKIGKVSRCDIHKEIESLKGEEREEFRRLLNKYRSTRND